MVHSLTIEQIAAKFPKKELPKIEGEPTYAVINEMIQYLYGNAATVPTSLGGGTHGHIGLVMKPATYTTLSGTPYEDPLDPGAAPRYPAGSTHAIRDQIKANWEADKQVFDSHSSMMHALKAQIFAAVDDVYICELKKKYLQYLGVSVRDILDHLLKR